MKQIITIGREFGSGGRELGCRLAEKLNIAYYDQEVISEIAKRTDFSEEYVHQIVEHRPITPFPLHIGTRFAPTVNPMMLQNQSIYQEQSRIIREMAEQSDCVIVGRCADYILREEKPFRIFVYADMESRIKRCREKASSQEQIPDKELARHILDIDKNRAKYYNFYTDMTWGDKRNYDLCVNTAQTKIKEIVPIIADYAKFIFRRNIE